MVKKEESAAAAPLLALSNGPFLTVLILGISGFSRDFLAAAAGAGAADGFSEFSLDTSARKRRGFFLPASICCFRSSGLRSARGLTCGSCGLAGFPACFSLYAPS
jgi:hypothetical protein